MGWPTENPALLNFDADLWRVYEYPSDEFFDESLALCPNDELLGLLHECTAGRIAPRLLSGEGLEAVRALAGVVFENHEQFCDSPEADAKDALKFILAQLKERIGDQPEAWLNSFSLLEKRLFGCLYEGACGNQKNPSEDDLTLFEIMKADGARALSPRVLQDRGGLVRLLRRHPEAKSIVIRTVTALMISGRGAPFHLNLEVFRASD